MARHQRLWGVAGVNLAVGVVAAGSSRVRLPNFLGLTSVIPPYGLRDILIVPLIASALCQAVLVALWASCSGASVWIRLVGLIAGAAYLEGLFALRGDNEVVGLGAVTVVVTAGALLTARASGVRLARQDGPGPGGGGVGGLRFSIRSLMILTAAVAVLSAATRAVQGTAVGYTLGAALWATCFTVVGLASLWAGLGDGPPVRRASAPLILSLTLATFFANAVHAHPSGWTLIVLTMLLFPAALLGSLLAVRSCGYRLIRRSIRTPSNEIRENRT